MEAGRAEDLGMKSDRTSLSMMKELRARNGDSHENHVEGKSTQND